MNTIDTGFGNPKVSLEPMSGRWTFIWISVSFACLSTFYFFWAYANFFSSILESKAYFENGDFPSRFERNEIAMKTVGNAMHIGVAGLFGFCASVCAIIAVCMYFHRASSNLHKYGLSSLNYTPGMAVGWFFIPFVQLVMPLLVAIELWKGSAGIAAGQTGADWKHNKVSPFVIIWYLAFILGFFYYIFSMFYLQMSVMTSVISNGGTNVESMLEDIFSTIQIIFFGYAFTWLIQGISLIFFTKKISEMQDSVAMA